eukprot:m.79730 g.79730  ORF g.79730 m.79730 type:complete len:1237 (+) comp8615_c0_seq1:266-3976(+)
MGRKKHNRNWSTGSQIFGRHEQRMIVPLDREASHASGFKRNKIRTTKYTWLTIIPRNLFEQFHRIANVYFLFIVALNWIPTVQAFGKQVTMVPLLFVLSVTFIKDFFEDKRRARQDKITNNKSVKVFSKIEGRFVHDKWKHLHVGDIVELECDEIIPADLLLLSSTHEEKVCFVETANLDGETNLKQRRVFADDIEIDLKSFDCEVECEAPNSKIYQFNGNIRYEDETVPLDTTNILLRGCVVRNTPSAIGMVLYAGPETKAMLNNTGPRSKRSKLEKEMNKQVLYCWILLVVLCTCGGLGAGVWTNSFSGKNVGFVNEEATREPALEGLIRVGTFFIILQVIVPISLYVSIELVKLFQVFFIQEDIELYDPESDTKMICRALNITEDLGQIEYVFSDKTGTLTQNKMVFHQCSINGVLYSHDPSDDYNSESTYEACNFPIDAGLVKKLKNDAGEKGKDSSMEHMFLLSMCMSNTVSPNKDRSGKLKYDAESPDESALVFAANVYGYKLALRTTNSIVANINKKNVGVRTNCSLSESQLESIGNLLADAEEEDVDDHGVGSFLTNIDDKEHNIKYEVLNVLGFDSTRKRMSVIFRLPDKTIRLTCKGADSAIYHVLTPGSNERVQSATMEHIDQFARTGFRTLCFAYKDIPEEEYKHWASRFQQANLFLGDQKKRKRKELIHEMEQDLTLLGATGIEDKLQEGVPDAIQQLRYAGLKIWLLTGDKQETAIEIALTCNLITPQMRLIVLNSSLAKTYFDKPKTTENKKLHDDARSDVLAMIERHLDELKETNGETGDIAIVVDGATLYYALHTVNDVNLRFLQLAEQSKVVVGCRATPLQKAQVVSLVKDNRSVMTLAIGDGANDVSMIHMAHVGVGISGQEGMQAVMASDFAIAQFRFLVKLMLVHGHWSYDRLSSMILYFFYKNSCLAWVVFFYQLFAGFSGQPAIEQLYLLTFNLLWTSIPPIVFAVFDQHVQSSVLLANPLLYQGSVRGDGYNGQFFPNMTDALYQGLIIFFVPYIVFSETIVNEGIGVLGTVMFYCVVLTTTLHLCLIARDFNIIFVGFLLISIALLFGFSFLYNSISYEFGLVPDPYFVFQHVVHDTRFWLCCLLVSVTSILPRIIIMVARRWFTPRIAMYARERTELKRRKCMSENNSKRGLFCAISSILDWMFPHSDPLVPENTHLTFPGADIQLMGIRVHDGNEMNGTSPSPQSRSNEYEGKIKSPSQQHGNKIETTL